MSGRTREDEVHHYSDVLDFPPDVGVLSGSCCHRFCHPLMHRISLIILLYSAVLDNLVVGCCRVSFPLTIS